MKATKTYFLVKPSEFSRFGDIDWDGNVDEVQCSNFELEEPRENVMIFEAYYHNKNGNRDFLPRAREFVSGKKFTLETLYTKKGTRCLNLMSEELGLYMERAIPIKEVEVSPLKVSGLLMYLQKNQEERTKYYYELKNLLETAKAYKNIYDSSLYGPSKYVTKETRRSYKRTK